jgi:hypothetical protein
MNAQGEIVLLEENFLWFGAGLEASDTEDTKSFMTGTEKRIRVLQERRFPISAAHRVKLPTSV